MRKLGNFGISDQKFAGFGGFFSPDNLRISEATSNHKEQVRHEHVKLIQFIRDPRRDQGNLTTVMRRQKESMCRRHLINTGGASWGGKSKTAISLPYISSLCS